MVEKIQNPPIAKALFNGARSIGNYDLAAALADLVDNSITANCTWVKILVDFNDGDPEVLIIDNGNGMREKTLIAAMKPASNDPEQPRAEDDLGRFGWGMKSASLSQAKSMLVCSKQNNILTGAEWDLDHIENWEMSLYSDSETKELLTDMEVQMPEKSGTAVIWRKCDRLNQDGTLNRQEFNALFAEAKEKLSLIFHRYLEKGANKKLIIKLNGIDLEPHDPFFTNHPATQPFNVEKLDLQENGIMEVQPFILPHFSKLSREEIKDLERREGSNRNQGFYVYRNDRLIINGTWFGIFKHGELSDLLRVRVDIPNTMDKFWKISIDKNDAKLPPVLKKRLKEVLHTIKGKSAKVYSKRGAKLYQKDTAPVWDILRKSGKTRYEINRDMPFLNAFLNELDDEQSRRFDALLSLVEQSLPISSISADLSKDDIEIVQEETDKEKADTYLRQMLDYFLEKVIDPSKPIEDQLFKISFFADKKKAVKAILKEQE